MKLSQKIEKQYYNSDLCKYLNISCFEKYYKKEILNFFRSLQIEKKIEFTNYNYIVLDINFVKLYNKALEHHNFNYVYNERTLIKRINNFYKMLDLFKVNLDDNVVDNELFSFNDKGIDSTKMLKEITI